MTALLLSLGAFIAILLGGFFSLKYKKHLHSIMGFAAGVLIGVVSFDILPEIMHISHEIDVEPTGAMIALVVGFLLFHILEKTILIHHCHHDEYKDHTHPHVGTFSSLALAGHSLLDGIAIGLGFQVSTEVGFLVALAVISHGFTDGMNTVTFMLRHKNNRARTLRFLGIHSLAPILGALATLFFTVSENFLVLYLGFFAGFLLYIGASDILPEAHSKRSSWKTIAFTILGALIIFLVSQVGHHG